MEPENCMQGVCVFIHEVDGILSTSYQVSSADLFKAMFAVCFRWIVSK